MPRKARIVLANCPHHIVQRGHNRAVIFAEDSDYLYYLENLASFTMEYRHQRHDGEYRWLLDTGTPRFTRPTYSHFARSFRRIAGVSSREYIRQHQ